MPCPFELRPNFASPATAIEPVDVETGDSLESNQSLSVGSALYTVVTLRPLTAFITEVYLPIHPDSESGSCNVTDACHTPDFSKSIDCLFKTIGTLNSHDLPLRAKDEPTSVKRAYPDSTPIDPRNMLPTP